MTTTVHPQPRMPSTTTRKVVYPAKALNRLIKGLRDQTVKAEGELNSLKAQVALLEHVQSLKGRRNLSQKDIADIMSLTCWGNLAFCCSPKKGCLYFLSACECLGLNPSEVAEAKENAISQMLKGKTR